MAEHQKVACYKDQVNQRRPNEKKKNDKNIYAKIKKKKASQTFQ